MPRKKPPFLRFLESYTKIESGCWEWNNYTKPNGYGMIKVFGENRLAHRYSYELHKGAIPDGMQVLHSCDNKRCVNPDHLRVGTHQENMQEASDRGLMRKGSAHPFWGVKVKRPSQAHKVWVLGKEYESCKDAERQLGLGSGTVRWWCINKPEKARRIMEG